MKRTRIAVTMGDYAGIGPEIIVKAVAALAPQLADGGLELVVIGSPACLARASEVTNQPFAPTAGTDLNDATGLSLVDIGAPEGGIVFGQVSGDAGRLAYLAIERAVRMALENDVDAIVTAPINKEALNLAGHAYSGHTELLSDLCGSSGPVMMLAHGHFRVSHVSTHVPLGEAVHLLTPERLTRVISLTHEALSSLGCAHPRIGVAALNPHAGEGGIFGRQDIDVTQPLTEKLRRDGLHVEGPIPGDTVFVKLQAGQYDAVVAMYHDQGHIPVKLLGFNVDRESGNWTSLSGVNISLGLPIVRTSVDHGTAFDIAGTGCAIESSLIEAIHCAAQLASARVPGRKRQNVTFA